MKSSGRVPFTRTPPFWFGVVGLLVAIPLGLKLLEGPPPPPLPTLGALPDFAFTSQEEKLVGLADLKGKPWVANFIFTSCPTVCPLLTESMAKLEKATAPLGEKVHFVSVSVDPENDTPEKLKAYGARFGQNPERWTMLTGPLESIEKTVIESFKVAIARTERPENPNLFEIVHGEHFVLVDAGARIRGYYRNEEPELLRLRADLERLVKEGK